MAACAGRAGVSFSVNNLASMMLTRDMPDPGGSPPHASPHAIRGVAPLPCPAMRTDTLDYHLPPDRIATTPAHPRDAARLMVIDRATGRIHHRRVADLSCLVRESPPVAGPRPGDLLVLNRSRVLPAHFHAQRAATGGAVTGLYLQSERDAWQVMLESRGKLQPGERLTLTPGAQLLLDRPLGRGVWTARLESETNTLKLLQRIGAPPLPPYIRKARRARHQPEQLASDSELYNTVYADEPGSIAAPTAGLHFTPTLLKTLEDTGVHLAFLTLHVGLGTFAPVRTERLEDHDIHEEWLSIPAQTIAALHETRQRGGRIIPVGTTTVRALESLPDPLSANHHDFAAPTRLFITPGDDTHNGFRFRFADALMTNFHLPRSTLLALVAAVPGVGVEQLKSWYRLAIEQHYRFYSYGDAMLIV